MASKHSDELKEIRRVVKRIDALRRDGAVARGEGRKSFPVQSAFDFEIIQRALEFFRETLNSSVRLTEAENPCNL